MHGDLRPYICIESDCKTPEIEYSRRHLWLEHVKQHHCRVYSCSLGCDIIIRSPEALHAHISDHHAGELSAQDLHSQALASVSTEMPMTKECPLCGDPIPSPSQYQRHVGRHQEQLALFALPDIASAEDEGRSEEEAARSKAGGEASSDSDAPRSLTATIGATDDDTVPGRDEDAPGSNSSSSGADMCELRFIAVRVEGRISGLDDHFWGVKLIPDEVISNPILAPNHHEDRGLSSVLKEWELDESALSAEKFARSSTLAGGSRLEDFDTPHWAAQALIDEVDVVASPPLIANRSNSHREPTLYEVTPGSDGFCHCPWEGTSFCNHKPENLKASYK